MEKENFVLIGAAGYIAPRHMKAIKEVGGELNAVLDPSDSVGILDSYFPGCLYFNEFERFDRYINKSKENIKWGIICSPNYLHDAHCRFFMRNGIDVICEKPLVLYERNLDELLKIEQETNQKISAIVQLRLHPEIIKLKENFDPELIKHIKIVYHTPRGKWYDYSWKGILKKSGGLITNIGVHLFDLLFYLLNANSCDYRISTIKVNNISVIGNCRIKNTEISFDLSINQKVKCERKIEINYGEKEIKLDNKIFINLHNESYIQIMKGNGFGIEDVRPSISIVETIRELAYRRNYGR